MTEKGGMHIIRLCLHIKCWRFGGKITSFNSRTSKTVKLKMSVSGNAKLLEASW